MRPQAVLKHNSKKASNSYTHTYCISVLALRGGALTLQGYKHTSNKIHLSRETPRDTHISQDSTHTKSKHLKKLIVRIGKLKQKLKTQLEQLPNKFKFKLRNLNPKSEDIQTTLSKLKRLRTKLNHYKKSVRAKTSTCKNWSLGNLSGPSPILEERECRTLPSGETNGNQAGPASNPSTSPSRPKTRHKRSTNALINRTLRRALVKKLRRQTARGRRKLQAEMATQPVTHLVAQDQGNLCLPNFKFDQCHPRNIETDTGAGIYHFLWAEELKNIKGNLSTTDHKSSHTIKATKTKIKQLKIAFWNTKGFSHLAAREKIICTMENTKLTYSSLLKHIRIPTAQNNMKVTRSISPQKSLINNEKTLKILGKSNEKPETGKEKEQETTKYLQESKCTT